MINQIITIRMPIAPDGYFIANSRTVGMDDNMATAIMHNKASDACMTRAMCLMQRAARELQDAWPAGCG